MALPDGADDVAVLRRRVCDMVVDHAYDRFPATWPTYTMQRLHGWLKHYPSLAMEAAQHGRGMASAAQLREKAEHKELLARAFALKAVQPEETVICLAREDQSFILQLEKNPAGELIFRTLAGTIAARCPWEAERPVRELPTVVVTVMKSAGFPMPFERFREVHLRILLPTGRLLNVLETQGTGTLEEQMNAP